MEIDWADWGPPLAVLVAGGVASLLTLQRIGNSGDGDRRVTDEARRIDLDSARAEAVEALKQLELDREKMDPAEYATERQRLVARGAAALAALEGAAPTPPSSPAPAAQAPSAGASAASASVSVSAPGPVGPPPVIAPEWRGAFYALAAVALGWLMWNFASSNSASRGSGSMTGNLPNEPVGGQQMQGDPTQSAEFKRAAESLQKAYEANPNDLEVLNELTHLYLSHGMQQQSLQWSDKALAVNPKDKLARTYRALMSAMVGLFDQAIMGLDVVLQEDPNFQDALVYKGLVLLQQQRFPEAAELLGRALQADPNNAELRARHQMALQGGAGAPPMPAGGADDLLAAGTVTIDPAVAGALTGSETLFVSLVNPAQPGPPVAAEKYPGPLAFPLEIKLTTASIRAMPGSSGVPAVMELRARIDADGNAMTKEPGLPLAVVTGVGKGQAGLPIVLTAAGTPTAAPPMAAAPPTPGGSPPPGAPPPGGAYASGRVTLGAGVAPKGTETLFVSIRDAAGGPPYASKKVVGATFPFTFALGPGDVIQMGGARPIPASFNVIARLDGDGNAFTKDDGPEVTLTGVAQGATGLELVVQ